MLIFFIVLFYCSIVLPIVLQSNIQPNYAYRRYAYKKNECKCTMITVSNEVIFDSALIRTAVE